jgi:hypothetical protein
MREGNLMLGFHRSKYFTGISIGSTPDDMDFFFAYTTRPCYQLRVYKSLVHEYNTRIKTVFPFIHGMQFYKQRTIKKVVEWRVMADYGWAWSSNTIPLYTWKEPLITEKRREGPEYKHRAILIGKIM